MRRINNRQKAFGSIVTAVFLSVVLAGCQISQSPVNTATAVPTETPTPFPTATLAPTPTPFMLEGATTTASGLQYLELVAGNGVMPKPGDIITLQYIASLTDGTELANSYVQNAPITTVWGANRLLPGWEEGIGLMNVGEKARIVIPPDLAFGANGSGMIPPDSQIVIEMELLAVKPAPVPTTVSESQLNKTDSGLQFFDLKVGDGIEAGNNYNVTTEYKIWIKTETGYTFIDQSEGNEPVKFVLGRGDTVFPGWDEGVLGMKVGGKRYLIIPPDLGLGNQGNSVIPANSTLVMEIELVDTKEPRVATVIDKKDFTTTASGLMYYDLVPGTGASPQTGQTVVVHYTGWLEDGTQFDSSIDRGQPFTFVIGQGNVIPGWDEGVATMKVGGKRQLMIPPDLGYGDSGAGTIIPPGAVLIFEVELLEIQ